MPRTKSMNNEALLTAALEGLGLQKRRIEEQIAHVRGLLGRRRGRPPGRAKSAPAKKRRRLSAAARGRIAQAQKRRWAEYRKKTGAKSE